MLRRRVVFQVGDIHYPDHQLPSLDLKDEGVAEALRDALAVSPLMSSMRSLLKQIEALPHAVVALNGDLTTKGDLAQYSLCVDYLIRSMGVADRMRDGRLTLVVVPGNHDVNRALSKSLPEADLVGKFAPLEAAWQPYSDQVLASTNPLILNSDGVGAKLRIGGLNSCFGCATLWRDVKLQGEVEALVAELSLGADISARISSLGARAEVIDAPAFWEKHLTDVVDSIDVEDSCAIVVAHHNILQQAQPRVDHYTDLMNAGLARQRLTALQRPIIYLHGHIHSDPIEVVTQHTPDYGELVCISAPEFCEGFNRIEIVYGEGGLPLGCEVTRFRVRLSGAVSPDLPSTRIRFGSAATMLSEQAKGVYRAMGANEDVARTDVLARRVAGLGDIDDAVDELEWFGLLETIPAKDGRRHNYRLVGMS